MKQARIEHAPNGSLLAYITIADAILHILIILLKQCAVFINYCAMNSFIIDGWLRMGLLPP